MLVSAPVNAITLIKRGCLEVNSVIEFETRDDIKKNIEIKSKDERSIFYLPYDVCRSSIDFVEYLTIYPDDVLKFIPYSKDKEATKLTKLRLYCQTEATGDTQVIDFVYAENADAYKCYRLKKVIVYDEYNYAYVYNIINITDATNYIKSIILNLETKKLEQTIISKDDR